MQHHYVGPYHRGDNRFFFGAPFAAGLLGGFAGGLLGTAFFRPRPFYPYPYPYYPPVYGYGYGYGYGYY